MNESPGSDKRPSPISAAPISAAPIRTMPTWWLLLLLLSALGAQAERILTTRSATGETPFHSANDRSRWCSVAALGNYGRFEIDDIITIRDTRTKRRTWNTIDMVRHRGRDGKQHYYSSKPPLLSAMHASVYAIVRLTLGMNILAYPFTAARIVLFIVNWLPLAGFWWIWGRYWQRQPMSLWAFTMIMLLTLWGTFVSTFANTLNNHLPGALAAGISLWALLKIIYEGKATTSRFILACAAAAMCAVCELPALSWTAAVCCLLVQIDLRKTITGIAVGMLPLAIGFAVLNIWAHGDLRPPYAHRAVGELVTSVDHPTSSVIESSVADSNQLLERMQAARAEVLQAVREKSFNLSSEAKIQPTRTEGVIELWDDATQFRFALVQAGQQIKIHHWDDWYDYPNSYWYPDRKQGVDRGEPSRANYVFQTTFGHHGLFSLTPMWLFLPVGVFALWQASSGPLFRRLFDMRVQLMLSIVATSLVCYAFYMARPLEDRNYGGVSCGFRWMHWFAPLWCWLVGHGLMALDARSSRRLSVWHCLAMVALAVSIASACLPWGNPWTSPWLTRFITL